MPPYPDSYLVRSSQTEVEVWEADLQGVGWITVSRETAGVATEGREYELGEPKISVFNKIEAIRSALALRVSRGT